eukprot:9504175-Pyramimonas_sp.AAC.1
MLPVPRKRATNTALPSKLSTTSAIAPLTKPRVLSRLRVRRMTRPLLARMGTEHLLAGSARKPVRKSSSVTPLCRKAACATAWAPALSVPDGLLQRAPELPAMEIILKRVHCHRGAAAAQSLAKAWLVGIRDPLPHADWRELLEIRHDDAERRVRLLAQGLEEALELRVRILASFVHEYEVDFPQRRRRRPPNFAILVRPFVIKNAVDSVHANVFDVVRLRQLGFEAVHELPSRTHNHHAQTAASGCQGRFQEDC